MVMYYFEYETEKLSQEFDNLNTAICFAIMDRENETGQFITIQDDLGNIILDKENFQEIYEEFTVYLSGWL